MNTTANLASGIAHYYDRVFLERAVAAYLFMRFGQMRPLPMKNSKIVKFRRYNSLAAATTALTEGTTPTGKDLTVTDLTATVAQYGDFITITDMLDMTNPDPILTEAAEVMGEQAGDTIDQIVRDVLAAGTSVFYSNGADRDEVNTIINATVIRKAVRTLKNNKARKISQILSASTGVGTTPVDAAYFGWVHPDVSYTLTGLTGFTKVKDYPNPANALPNELGSFEDVRFMETTQCKLFAGGGTTGGTSVKETSTNADVYQTIIVAANAYGVVPLGQGMNAETIFKPLGSAGTADPLEQKSTLGWKIAFTAKILNDAFMTRIESAASA